MFLQIIPVTEESFVSDIVRGDYRTARVFRKYGIDYCCGGKWPLATICDIKGLDFSDIKNELALSVRTIQLPNSTPFNTWSIDFLTDYIVNVHHHYLRDTLPAIKDQLDRFAESHAKKYGYLQEVQEGINFLFNDTFPHLAQEEEIFFPYIRQIAHAYDSKEPYARLLVRTLRKPVEAIMLHEQETISKTLQELRQLTNHYQPPANACVSHGVIFSLLNELDNDLVQHLYLENQILFPKAIAIEKELLGRE